MRTGKGRKKEADDSRPTLTMREIGLVLGISRQSLVRRIERERFSLVGIPSSVMKNGNLYDMEAVFKRVFPSADDNTISLMMFMFFQAKNERKERLRQKNVQEKDKNGSGVHAGA